MTAGKGDKPRPFDKARFDANYSGINWRRKCSHDYKNAVLCGVLEWRCPDCGADISFGKVMLIEAQGWK